MGCSGAVNRCGESREVTSEASKTDVIGRGRTEVEPEA